MSGSRFDRFYRSILLSKYFIKGWGSPETLKRLLEFRKVVANRDSCFKLVDKDHPVQIIYDEEFADSRVLEGKFITPFDTHLPGILPPEAREAHFQMILPKEFTSKNYRPVVLHMAGTGDHYFWRRRQIMVKPLLRETGIGSVLLENPFYGTRKPMNQVRSVLHNVSDIFVMGGCLILEAIVLFHWLLNNGYGPLGVTGFSMGGHMASLAATSWPKPIVLVPCLSWSTASGVFTEGVMSHAIDWSMLANQYLSDETFHSELQKMVTVVEDSAFKAGQEFVKTFPDSMTDYKFKDGKLEFNQTPPFDDISTTRLHQISKGRLSNFGLVSLMQSKLLNAYTPPAIFNYLTDFLKSSRKEEINWRHREVLHFMRGIMDECTHLKNFSKPVDPSLVITVCAKDDGYVPRANVTDVKDLWPEAEVRYINAGHISGFILHQKMFRQAIKDGFDRYKSKYMPNET